MNGTTGHPNICQKNVSSENISSENISPVEESKESPPNISSFDVSDNIMRSSLISIEPPFNDIEYDIDTFINLKNIDDEKLSKE